ncbi:MAG: NAD(P)-binding domain-containing protein, partial [Phaeodactylibacter sp.]|nr:NAD(P)-binding domain-containing protein [Phaeodactylibacter sp.]
MSSNKGEQRVGIIGAGSFGTAIANLLAYNTDVLLFSRKPGMVSRINNTHENLGINISSRVKATDDIQELAERCTLIFPVVPSGSFRNMMRDFAP